MFVNAMDRALLDYLYSTSANINYIAIKHGVSKQALEEEIEKTKRITAFIDSTECSCCGRNKDDYHSNH